MNNKKGRPNLLRRFVENIIARPLSILPIRDIMVFESHSDFCDNSRALFEKIIEKELNNKYKIYWLVEEVEKFRDKNIKNVKFLSIKRDTILRKIINEIRNAVLFARCKYYFFSHRNFARTQPKEGQVYFNLTHGMSLKDTRGKQGIDVDKLSYILVTSDFSSELRARTYGGGDSKMRVLGFPRNDLLFNNGNNLKKFNINKSQYKNIIVWLPTFRRQKNFDRNDSGAKGKSDLPILKEKEDILELDNYLDSKKTLLIIKPHPAQDMNYFKEIIGDNIKVITNKDMVKKDIQLYELLGESDALITDYSSVYIDYLNLDRPIGFTVDDLDDYRKTLGFLVDNPLDYMPGHKIKTCKDMVGFIESVSTGEDNYGRQRENICKIFNKYSDNKSSERIINYLALEGERVRV